MALGKKIKQARKRGNTARAERLQIKQAKRKSKRVTLYTPGKKQGKTQIGRKAFNRLALMNGDFGKDSGEKFYRPKSGIPNLNGSYYNEDQNAALKTLRKKLGFDDFSGGNLGKAQRAINFSNPTVVQQAAAPAAPANPQSNKGQISQASKDYRNETKDLLDQASDIRAAFADDQARATAARVKREQIAARTEAARSGNARIASRSANLQIQPASTTSQTAGTQAFKRRKKQFNASNYGGVASIMSGILNI